MIKKLLLSLCLVVCLSGQVGHCSETEKEYRITEPELTQLEVIFQELKNSNEVQIAALNQSKTDLTIARDDLEKYRTELNKQKEVLIALKAELTKARNELRVTQDELRKANELLTKYAEKEKRTRKRLEYQRNGWALVAVIGIAAAV